MLFKIYLVYLTIKKDANWNEEGFNLRVRTYAKGCLVKETT